LLVYHFIFIIQVVSIASLNLSKNCIVIYADNLNEFNSHAMPSVKCPITGCDYATEDCDAAIVIQLLQLHATSHTRSSASPPPSAKVEKVTRPSVSSSGTSEEWAYFKIRWAEYVQATGITGKDLVIQLLECCDEELRKDLTRSTGASLTTGR
jgi:hypothetical protein